VSFVSPRIGFGVAGGTLSARSDAAPSRGSRAASVVADEGLAAPGAPRPPVAGGVLVKTTDGGSHWSVVPSAPGDAQSVCFLDASRGWLGAAGVLFLTSDGGSHWSEVADPEQVSEGSSVPGPLDVEVLDCGSPTTVFDLSETVDDVGAGNALWAVFASANGRRFTLVAQDQYAPGKASPPTPGTYPGAVSVVGDGVAAVAGFTPAALPDAARAGAWSSCSAERHARAGRSHGTTAPHALAAPATVDAEPRQRSDLARAETRRERKSMAPTTQRGAEPAGPLRGGPSAAAVPISVAEGDGIGPEIMAATLEVLLAAGARLSLEPIRIGRQVYLDGVSSGIEPAAWESIRRTKVLLKAPITTPQGGGYKSLNVTIRKTLGLFANVRPCPSYAPYVATLHPSMDLVIVRENEEDLYGGIEHRQTTDVVQCLKLISRPGSERVIRYAFAYARRYGRDKVHCFTKDNIMKLTDGLFHAVFDEVAKDYPEIRAEHMIVDIGTARLAAKPESFDVIVVPNLYGDIISDVAAEISGSVGLGGSANIGTEAAMFEAIHGSAPDLAGKGVANPSGLLLAAVQMLVHIGQGEIAELVHNAWLATIEQGVHTADIYDKTSSSQLVGTAGFASAVVARLGATPRRLATVRYPVSEAPITVSVTEAPRPDKVLVGTDVFVEWHGSIEELARRLESAARPELGLVMVTNRGQKVYPEGAPETFCVDHWRCRYQSEPLGAEVDHAAVLALLGRLVEVGLPFVKTEGLYFFDGEPGFSLGQGQ
jgi:isocitrate dehydrogenase